MAAITANPEKAHYDLQRLSKVFFAAEYTPLAECPAILKKPRYDINAYTHSKYDHQVSIYDTCIYIMSYVLTTYYSREGTVLLPYKRPRLSTQKSAPQAKRARTEDASSTGVTALKDNFHKYSPYVNSSLLTILSSNMSDNSKQLLSAAFSKSSWKAYESAWNSLHSFEASTKSKLSWPLSQTTLCEYISWATLYKKLRISTVETYVNSLSSVHQLLGFDRGVFGSLATKAMIRGSGNLSAKLFSPKHTRKVFSLALLKVLGNEISQQTWSDNSKRVYWTCACVAFFGCFRIGELLASSDKTYDPTTTLMWKDIKFGQDNCIVHVKSPKSNRREGEFVDLFETPDHGCCPVRCLRNLGKGKGVGDSTPVFIFDSGVLLSPRNFNSTLRSLLSPILGLAANQFSSHSLRAGIPSALARFPGLVEDEDIKGWGRWDSPCFTRYTRLEMDRKRFIYSKITSVLFSGHASTSGGRGASGGTGRGQGQSGGRDH